MLILNLYCSEFGRNTINLLQSTIQNVQASFGSVYSVRFQAVAISYVIFTNHILSILPFHNQFAREPFFSLLTQTLAMNLKQSLEMTQTMNSVMEQFLQSSIKISKRQNTSSCSYHVLGVGERLRISLNFRLVMEPKLPKLFRQYVLLHSRPSSSPLPTRANSLYRTSRARSRFILLLQVQTRHALLQFDVLIIIDRMCLILTSLSDFSPHRQLRQLSPLPLSPPSATPSACPRLPQ